MNLLHHIFVSNNQLKTKTAVQDQSDSLSYVELENKSNQFAVYLMEIGCRPGDVVAICMKKTVYSVVSILGILKAGAAYLPLDITSPPKRNQFILNDSTTKFVIFDQENIRVNDSIVESTDASPILFALKKNNSPFPNTFVFRKEGNLLEIKEQLKKVIISQDAVSYILYTSGSTGTPKGIIHTQKSALTFIHWAINYFKPHADDVFSSHAPFHFDLSIFDIFVSLKVGASLCLIPKIVTAMPSSLANYIEKNKITIWYSVPSALVTLIESRLLDKLGSLKKIIYAGESFPMAKLIKLVSILEKARYYNLYGPSESNVITYYEINKKDFNDKFAEIPLGYACPYAKLLVVTEGNTLASVGEVGELVVSSESLMQGYLNRNDLTKETMIKHLSQNKNSLYYKTGDLVKVIEPNKYEFVSRKDQQIKINGFRIDLNEIESVSYQLPNILDVAVMPLKKFDNTNYGIALFLSFSRYSLSEQEISSYLREHLPAYMIPCQLKVCERILRNSRGKLDYSALKKSITYEKELY